jgi:ABC-type nitrate/sulfonate/bicarbonate transport system permease component
MRKRLRTWWPPVLVLVGLLLLLQLLSMLGVIHDFVIPRPSRVIQALMEEHEVLWPHIVETAKISLFGFFLSVIFGALVALAMDQSEGLYRAFYPLVVVSQTIPTMVITPVIVLLFGFGTWPRLIVVVLVCFFPLTLSFLNGLSGIDRDLIRLMHTMGATGNQILFHVKIPGALPSFFSGLRISATYCVMAAVLAEWSGSGKGLGIYMMRARRSYGYDRMFASIIWIVAVSLIFYLAASCLGMLAMPWQKKERMIPDEELYKTDAKQA